MNDSTNYILNEIEKLYPFPPQDIRMFYDLHPSLDLLIDVCEFAAQQAFGDVFSAFDNMLKTDETMSKPILCLDFDGVCNSYTSGWVGADNIPDDPMPGLFEFLEEAAKIFDIQIYSSRNHLPGGIQAMQSWFVDNRDKWMRETGYPAEPLTLKYPVTKPAAYVGIDDRVLTFKGLWPSIEELKAFQPWRINA